MSLNYSRIKIKKRYGQHFLVSKQIGYKLVELAEVNDKDIVLEIGAGTGSLTSILKNKANKVIAVEKDPELFEFLKRKFSFDTRVELLKGDILEIKLPRFNKIVSTPPYNISSKLILFIINKKIDSATLILQKEFAERLIAKCGTKNYGRLTVSVGRKAFVEILDYVSRNAFYPPPKVDSAIVKIIPKKSEIKLHNELFFNELIRELFTQRRKKLKKVLAKYLEKTHSLDIENVLLNPAVLNKRVYELSVKELELISDKLYDEISKHNSSKGLLSD
ncbi:MAG: 16S rRNA (adenine(1518)-N(6)/adenine(1519)-N(6))-dimethyltransferase RsmA [Candidatus Bathyarchaeia archaeon]